MDNWFVAKVQNRSKGGRIVVCQKMARPKPHTLKKINSKLTLNVKYKTVDLLEENIGENLVI